MADKDLWAKGRMLWEADPTMTFADAAKVIGVSRQIVARRGKEEGWTKLSDQDELNRRAYDKADKAALTPTAAAAAAAVGGEGVDAPSPVAMPTDHESIVAETATDLRANVITRHRKEWGVVRSMAYRAIQAQSFEQAKLAKISAEAVKIIQDGERKAWGLDAKENEGNTGAVKVVIERRDM